MKYFADFGEAIRHARGGLVNFGEEVDPGHWQGVPTEGKPDLLTKELLDVVFAVSVFQAGYLRDKGYQWELMRDQIQPNLPWADQHFEERVSRVPSNPGEAYKEWPWWHGQFEVTSATPIVTEVVKDGFGREYAGKAEMPHKFTHTYQERFWPKYAEDEGNQPKRGIRYTYGDLDDVVGLLLREPHTRQAWLPIFFPEDTGAVHGGRIPCTIGYQFMLRGDRLYMWYIIRSCDFVRHFRDDLYLAARLMLWVLDELQRRDREAGSSVDWDEVIPGYLHFHCFSLHYHQGDAHLL